MPKAEYNYALDNDNNLYACFGRTAKFIYVNGGWVEVLNPDDYEDLFDDFGSTKTISKKEALKITNNVEPINYFVVQKRVYLTEEEINKELKDLMNKRKYTNEIKTMVYNADLETRILVLEWLVKHPNLHELTIEVLVMDS